MYIQPMQWKVATVLTAVFCEWIVQNTVEKAERWSDQPIRSGQKFDKRVWSGESPGLQGKCRALAGDHDVGREVVREFRGQFAAIDHRHLFEDRQILRGIPGRAEIVLSV